MKKIILIGATGFIGKHLVDYFNDYVVKSLHGSDVIKRPIAEIAKEIDNYDIIINVAGRNIFGYWTKRVKKEIFQSRIGLTRKLIAAIEECRNPPGRFLSASAVGIYNDNGIMTEKEGSYASNFLAKVVKEWEYEAFKAMNKNVKVSVMRFGIVLGKDGGAYKIMRKLARFNLGAYFNNGRQHLSFIYISDLCRAVTYIIERDIEGIINVTAPESTDYKTVWQLLKRKVNAFIIWKIPSFLPRLLLGEASVIYLEGQNVIPEVLIKNNFNFEASNISDCINKIEAN
ncbi:MAG TPA: TIGR01777 family oxidoreductase [Bacteroidales bacterium]|nr:TIGR01777 family oxidoreductase [Bacteroidales bacterium]